MTSSADGAIFIVGTLAVFALAAIGVVVVGVLAVLGALTLRHTIEKVEAADALIEMEREKMKLEGMVKDG